MVEQRYKFTPQGRERWDLAAWRITGNSYDYIKSLLNNPEILPQGILEGGETVELLFDQPQQRKKNTSIKPPWETD